MKYKITPLNIFPHTLNEALISAFSTTTSRVASVTKTPDGTYILEWNQEPEKQILDFVQTILEKRVIMRTEKT